MKYMNKKKRVYKMIKNLKIFESNTNHGPMTIDRTYYPIAWNDKQIISDFEKRMSILGTEIGFDDKKIVFPHRDDIYTEDAKIGSYINIEEDLLEILKNNIHLPYDIIMTNSDTKGIVLAAETADMPVVIMRDEKTGAIALSYCEQGHIGNQIPLYMVAALKNEYNTDVQNIKVYISSCAHPENYALNHYPMWAYNDEVWAGTVMRDTDSKKEKYHINLRSAILKQLLVAGISAKNIKSNMHDTIKGKNPYLYSEYAANYGIEEKHGKYIVGAFFEEEPKVRIKK